MAWTEAQEKAITSRNQNLLLSAAAGSGKTAVLVERIIRRLIDVDNPTDITEIMVVTFTKAAAGEMRERIGVALLKASMCCAPGFIRLIWILNSRLPVRKSWNF